MNPFEYGKSFHNKSYPKRFGTLTPPNPKIFNVPPPPVLNRLVLIGLSSLPSGNQSILLFFLKNNTSTWQLLFFFFSGFQGSGIKVWALIWKKSLKSLIWRSKFVKGLASCCKAETTFTFHFSIINASESIWQCWNREIKSESGFSFARASQPL